MARCIEEEGQHPTCITQTSVQLFVLSEKCNQCSPNFTERPTFLLCGNCCTLAVGVCSTYSALNSVHSQREESIFCLDESINWFIDRSIDRVRVSEFAATIWVAPLHAYIRSFFAEGHSRRKVKETRKRGSNYKVNRPGQTEPRGKHSKRHYVCVEKKIIFKWNVMPGWICKASGDSKTSGFDLIIKSP